MSRSSLDGGRLQQLVGTIDSGFVGLALYGQALGQGICALLENGLFMMNRYCCGTVLVVRLADVLRGAEIEQPQKRIELIRSPGG